jgi:hypothetical protein
VKQAAGAASGAPAVPAAERKSWFIWPSGCRDTEVFYKPTYRSIYRTPRRVWQDCNFSAKIRLSGFLSSRQGYYQGIAMARLPNPVLSKLSSLRRFLNLEQYRFCSAEQNQSWL